MWREFVKSVTTCQRAAISLNDSWEVASDKAPNEKQEFVKPQMDADGHRYENRARFRSCSRGQTFRRESFPACPASVFICVHLWLFFFLFSTAPMFAANQSPAKSSQASSPAKSKKQKHAPGEEIFDNKTVQVNGPDAAEQGSIAET